MTRDQQAGKSQAEKDLLHEIWKFGKNKKPSRSQGKKAASSVYVPLKNNFLLDIDDMTQQHRPAKYDAQTKFQIYNQQRPKTALKSQSSA